MRIDEYDFEKTAKAIQIMNPYWGDTTWQDIRSQMIDMAYMYMHESNSFSTGGFCLTAYNAPGGERVVRASVNAYVAYSYVERILKENTVEV